MQILIYTILCALATWRLTYDIVELEGPFGIYKDIREHVEQSEFPEWVKNGIQCKYCVSFWVGFLVSLFTGLSFSEYILVSLASSGAVTFYMRYLEVMYNGEM